MTDPQIPELLMARLMERGQDHAQKVERVLTDCLFCDRGAHEILGESTSWYIRLDAFPALPGHVEVVTKRHIGSFFDMDGGEAAELPGVLGYARTLVADRFGEPDGWTIGINDGPAAGQSIPHLHAHLIPRRHGDVPDPRGGIRRALPNCTPDVWAVTR